MTTPTQGTTHALSFDVECFHQYNRRDFLGEVVEPRPEVERATHWILDRLAERGVFATFYVLGNVAERFPGLVRRMADDGHEIGLHGYDHRYLHDLDATSFEAEMRRALDAVDRAAGVRCRAHRAPRFSLSPRTPFAFEVLTRLGFTYDSSIVPARGAHGYGDPRARREPHRHASGLVEVPLTTVSVFGRRVPACGGGYVRYAPLEFTNWAFAQREAEGLPVVAYFHPYEFEPTLPSPYAPRAPLVAQLRYARFCAMQSVGRGLPMRSKLVALLDRHAFGPVRAIAEAVA